MATKIDEQIVKAIEESEFQWRTVKGIAKQLEQPEDVIQKALDTSEAVLRSQLPNKNGHSLYTTRLKYMESMPDSARFMAALKNEVTTC